MRFLGLRRGLLLLPLLLLALTPPASARPSPPEASVLTQDDATEGAGRQVGLLPVRVALAPGDGEGRGLTTAVEIVLLLSFLTLLPSLLLTMTCFTRVIVVLSFVRRAMSTPELPPNPVMIGLALFISIAVMKPVGDRIYEKAITPYTEEQIDMKEAGNIASKELKDFMLRFTRDTDVQLFLDVSGTEGIESPEDLPLAVVVPSFILSELKTAFTMGFLLYLPFLVVDIVVSSILLSMGMFMLPPVMISTPLKILLFVMVDGWHLVITQLWGGLTG